MVMLVSPIALLALDDIAIRRLAQDSSGRDEILGTSFVLMIGGGVLAFVLAMAAIFLARPEDHLVQWLVGILAAGTIVQAFIAIEFWFESQMQWQFTVYAKTSAFLLLSLVKLGLILLRSIADRLCLGRLGGDGARLGGAADRLLAKGAS